MRLVKRLSSAEVEKERDSECSAHQPQVVYCTEDIAIRCFLFPAYRRTGKMFFYWGGGEKVGGGEAT